jgi:hypothetical protein
MNPTPSANTLIGTRNSQWPILGLLRFFLAATVVLGHYAILVKPDKHHIFGDAYLNPGSAVLGFFIISGFSIAASLEREQTGFYRRRFVRIWPLYLASIGFGLLVYLLVPNGFTWPIGEVTPPASTLSIVASVLMLQNFIGFSIPMLSPIWSLSSEWWHYMLAPLLKKVPNAALLVLIGVSFAAFMLIEPPSHHGVDVFEHGMTFVVLSWIWVTGFLYYRLRGTPLGFLLLSAPTVFAATLGHPTGRTALHIDLCRRLELGDPSTGSTGSRVQFPRGFFVSALLISLACDGRRAGAWFATPGIDLLCGGPGHLGGTLSHRLSVSRHFRNAPQPGIPPPRRIATAYGPKLGTEPAREGQDLGIGRYR